jgi:predicted N-acyltransferase
LTGDVLTSAHAEAMFQFYQSTAMKKGGFLFLTADFFRQIFRTMKDSVLLILAEKPNGEPVAGALHFYGPDTLFGRNWGCLEEYRSLHLELCYYQGIEFAIEKKIKLFEAGAQGEHKFQRGFLPRLTYSAHKIPEPRLSRAIGNYIEQEKKQIELVFESYRMQTPYSRAEQQMRG